eukprot:s181_g20.t1
MLPAEANIPPEPWRHKKNLTETLATSETRHVKRRRCKELMGAAVGKKPSRLAKSEVYIKCASCKLAATEAWTQVALKVSELPAGTLGELEIDDVLSTICDPDDNGGEWMTHYDIVQEEASQSLTLESKGELGECRRECNTIAHACSAVFDEHREDMTEMLYKNYRLASEKKLSVEKFELAKAQSVAGYDLLQANCQHYVQDFWKFAVGHGLGMPNQDFLNLFQAMARKRIRNTGHERDVNCAEKLPVVPPTTASQLDQEVVEDASPAERATTGNAESALRAPVVVTIAATNRYHCLDEALVRPGRLDRIVMVNLPNYSERVATLQIHSAKLKTENLDVQLLARRTEGMSGADLANLLNEAALLAARRRADAVRMEHIWAVLANPRPQQNAAAAAAPGWNDDAAQQGFGATPEYAAKMFAAFAAALGASRGGAESSRDADSFD